MEVKVRYDGGFTHGRRCGTYDLRKATNSTKLSRDATTDIAWPAFLRRAQLIRFEITAPPALVQRLPCLATVRNVLLSVCNFLQSSKALRSLTANLSSLSAHNGASRNMHRLLDGLTASVCPLRPMPHGQNPQIDGVPYETDDLPTASPLTLSLADGLLSGSTWSLLRQPKRPKTLRECFVWRRYPKVLCLIVRSVRYAYFAPQDCGRRFWRWPDESFYGWCKTGK